MTVSSSTEVTSGEQAAATDWASLWRRASATRTIRTALRAVIVTIQIIAGLAVWQAAVMLLKVDPRIVPAPTSVLYTLWALILSGQLTSAIAQTMGETIGGFIIGSIFGIALAVVLSEIRLLRTLLQPYIIALQAVPKVAVAPLFLIWFGFGAQSKVALVVSIMFFPVLVNTMAGLSAVSDDQLELMRALRATRWQTLRRVKAFVALPFVFAAFEVSLVLSLTAAVVAEMLGSGTTIGLGTLINVFDSRFNTAGVFAILLVLSLMGVLLHAAVVLARRRLLRWQSADRND